MCPPSPFRTIGLVETSPERPHFSLISLHSLPPQKTLRTILCMTLCPPSPSLHCLFFVKGKIAPTSIVNFAFFNRNRHLRSARESIPSLLLGALCSSSVPPDSSPRACWRRGVRLPRSPDAYVTKNIGRLSFLIQLIYTPYVNQASALSGLYLRRLALDVSKDLAPRTFPSYSLLHSNRYSLNTRLASNAFFPPRTGHLGPFPLTNLITLRHVPVSHVECPGSPPIARSPIPFSFANLQSHFSRIESGCRVPPLIKQIPPPVLEPPHPPFADSQSYSLTFFHFTGHLPACVSAPRVLRRSQLA